LFHRIDELVFSCDGFNPAQTFYIAGPVQISCSIDG